MSVLGSQTATEQFWFVRGDWNWETGKRRGQKWPDEELEDPGLKYRLCQQSDIFHLGLPPTVAFVNWITFFLFFIFAFFILGRGFYAPFLFIFFFLLFLYNTCPIGFAIH